ncbi:MAG: TonB-dependent receptor plug domain-containing protein [Cryomorphaceae bacterium]|nr:TonB-dependent receptor [Flavobacteriales bacterium]
MVRAAFVFLFAVAFAFAEAQEVKIVDETGNTLADVQAIYTEQGRQKLLLSNADGRLHFDGIEKGTPVVLRALGYKTDTVYYSPEISTLSLKTNTYGLSEFVITAQYRPTLLSESVHNTRTIGAEEIRERAAVTLEDLLQNELNFRVSQDNILGAGLEMQGISGENVKIMIDGVPVVGRLNGNIDLSQINLSQIERVEIVEGPLAVNYGSNALAGTINLISKSPKSEETAITASGFTESSGHYNTNGSISHGWGKNTVRVSGGRNFFDGWSPDHGAFYHRRSQVADHSRVQQWNPREQLFADAKFRRALTKGYFEVAGSAFDEEITNLGAPRGAYRERALDDVYATQRYGANAKFQLALIEKWNTHHVVGYNYFKRTKSTYATNLTGVERQLSDNPSLRDTSVFANFLARGSFTGDVGGNLELQVGYEAEAEKAVGKRINDETGIIENYSLFATAEWKPAERFTVKPGLRAAYNSRYTAPVSPSLNLLYQTPEKAEVRLSYAQGFRAPGLKELSFYFVDINHNIVGNPDLKAEESHNLSASVKRRARDERGVSWEVSGFYNHIDNLITLAQTTGNEFSYVNVGTRRTTGIRTEAGLNVYDIRLDAGVSYTGLSNRILANDAGEFTFYPEATFRMRYTWEAPEIGFNLFYKYNGRRSFLQQTEDGEVFETFIESYQNLDFTLSKPFLKGRFTWDIGVRNLLDVQNIQATVAGGAHGGGGSRAIGTGRTFFTRLSMNLNLSK